MNRLDKLSKKYNLEIIKTGKAIEIKPVFNLTEKADIGSLLLIFGPLVLLIYVLIKTNDLDFSILLLAGLCLFISIFSIISIFKKIFDKVKITNNEIIFTNSFAKKRLKLTTDSKFKLEKDDIKIKLRRSTGYQTIIDLYIIDKDKRYRFLDFSSDTINSIEIVELGDLIIAEIKNSL